MKGKAKEPLKAFTTFIQGLRVYHRHEVVGMENLPRQGPAMIVISHSLATYDILMLSLAISRKLGRSPKMLVDRMFFKNQKFGKFMTAISTVQASPEAAEELLKSGEIVFVSPGGMREALRSSSERYQIRWDRRYGFSRIALRTGVPLILATCPTADHIFDVYSNKLTPWIYQRYRLPFALIKGIGPTAIPKPVKLVHFLSEVVQPPVVPDDISAADFEELAQTFQAEMIQKMQHLIDEALKYKPA